MAGVVLMATACEQELSTVAEEGAVNLDINLSSETRAVNGGDFTPEVLKVRIYREDGSLIRRYTSMEEIPAPLYLVGGNYSAEGIQITIRNDGENILLVVRTFLIIPRNISSVALKSAITPAFSGRIVLMFGFSRPCI